MSKHAIYLTFFIAIAAVFVLGTASMVAAQALPEESIINTPTTVDLSDSYYRAKVVAIIETGEKEVEEGQVLKYQKLELEILNGNEKGKHITIDHGGSFVVAESQMVAVGEKVFVAKTPDLPGGREIYYITDKYRVHNLAFITVVFFGLAIYFGRRRGLTSIIGLIFSVLVVFYFIIPRIIHGSNPFLVCIIGSLAILFTSLYISHGFSKRTSVAVGASAISLGLAIVINIIFVSIAKLSGSGAEEVFYLQFSSAHIDLRGLLLGGIIIGVLGVLDDVTTSQTAAVEEISLANSSLGFKELYIRGISVGREHIASLVNTLVLAYVGVSLPLLLLYSSQKTQPFLMTINSAFIAEEIVRTLVGSATLVLAVPITTCLAAWVYSRQKIAVQQK
ncbi:MAG: YibE/F family protein [Candidatus Magasanikbacteria bacterium]|nr:YibE/F family protein [Candidatus Magasanikbacteria bacterium]